MFIAKFNRRVDTAQGTQFHVDFINGENVVSEWCIPQDEAAFHKWVEDRKKTLNTSLTLKDKLTEGQELVAPIQEEVVPEPLTAEEEARNAWLEQWHTYERAAKAMKALSDAGIQPTAEETERFNALKTWVADNRKPEYSQYM